MKLVGLSQLFAAIAALGAMSGLSMTTWAAEGTIE